MWCTVGQSLFHFRMGFIYTLDVFVMKVVKQCFSLLIVIAFLSCSRWPTVVVGDSSGYLQYNRSTGVLEILWEKHFKTKDSVYVQNQPDTIPKVPRRD